MKRIFTAITGILISFLSFSQAPTANGNLMNFSSIASYELYAEDEGTWNDLRTIAQQSSTLTTIAEQELALDAEDTLYAEFLKEVLNTDHIFQIGNYLVKIDVVNDRGLVIAAGNSNAYSDLVNNNLSAFGMMVLDGEEDFGLELLEALENNSILPSEYISFLAERSCPGAKRRKQANIEEWTTTGEPCDIGGSGTLGKTYGMDNKAVYQKFIFYFSLQSKIKSVWRCTYGGSWNWADPYVFVDLKLVSNVKYRKRCEAEVNKDTELYESYFGGGDGVLHWRPYSAGRSLSHYDFHVDFGIRPAQDRNPNPPPYYPSMHYNIKSGY